MRNPLRTTVLRSTFLIWALALLLGVAGCGSGGSSPGDDPSRGETQTTTQKGGGYDYGEP